MPTNEELKGKEHLYTSDDDTANEEHGTPHVNSDRDADEVVEGLKTLTVTKKATPTMNGRTRHPKWLTELNEKVEDFNVSSKYQFTHGKKAVCPAGRWWFGCLDSLPETLRSSFGVTSEPGTLGDAYLGYVSTQVIKESASETPGNRVWYFALTSVSQDDAEFPFLISRFTGNLSDVGEVKHWFVGLPLDKLPKRWNTFPEFEAFGKAEDVKHDFYPECSGSLISGDSDVEGRLPECFKLKKVYWGDTLKTWTGQPQFYPDNTWYPDQHWIQMLYKVDYFVGDPITFFTALFGAFITFGEAFRDDCPLSCDTTLFRIVADIEQKLNKILDENEAPGETIPICVTLHNDEDEKHKFLVELYKERKVAVPEGELKWASFKHESEPGYVPNGEPDGEPGTVKCLFTSGLFASIKVMFRPYGIGDFLTWVYPPDTPGIGELDPYDPNNSPLYESLDLSLSYTGFWTTEWIPARRGLTFEDEGRITPVNDDPFHLRRPIPPTIMEAQDHINHYRKYARTSASDININNIVDDVRCVQINIDTNDNAALRRFLLEDYLSEDSDSEEDLTIRLT